MVESRLYFDPSASHMAYVVATLDHVSKIANIDLYGMLWTKVDWSRGQRYVFIQDCVHSLIRGDHNFIPNRVITEAFFANPRMKSGTFVTPIVNGIIEAECARFNCEFKEVSPPHWRKVMGIKPTLTNGKRDFKVPTREAVLQYVKVSDSIKSNITGKDRDMPHDITDALAIALADLKSTGYSITSDFNTLQEYDTFHKLYEISKRIK